jgi:prepilin signal peptidase PulO-like enzyme (type II secretory pathway)
VPVALITALISGSAVSLGLIAARRAGLKSAMPFGAFLAVGAAVAATVGAHLLDWYVDIF